MDDSNTTGLTGGTAQPFDSLKDTIEDLTNGLAKFEKSQNLIQVQVNPSAVQQPTQQPANQQLRPPHTTDNYSTSLPQDTPTFPRPPQTTPNKKFNVVIFGIKESPSNTPKETRLKHELDNLCHTLSNIDSSLHVNSSCIHDFHRLGKFNPTSLRPCPLLVKFLRIYDTTLLLSKRSSLPSPIVVNPDLTREERALHSAFLKIRWNLIQNGTDKKCIWLRGSNILINKLLYAK